jgi:hypothetical protein
MPLTIETATADLRAGFDRVRLPLDVGKREELCRTVHAYVDAVRELGWSPERAVIARSKRSPNARDMSRRSDMSWAILRWMMRAAS